MANKIFPEAIIFDMDGVITDSEPLQMEAERLVCDKFGISVPLEEWKNFKGKTNKDIFSYIIKEYSDKPLPVQQLVDEKRKKYIEISSEKLTLVDGFLDFIEKIRKMVPLIALTTSSNAIVQKFVFDKYNLNKYFDVITTGDEVKNGKPHPESYLLTVNKLGVRPQDAIVIEDSDNGIISAKAAGCTVVAITTSFPQEVLASKGADYVVDSFSEIMILMGNKILRR